MKKITKAFESLFPLLRNIFIPAILTTVGLLYFFAQSPISESSQTTLHYLFYTIIIINFLILFYFNQDKGFFFLLITILCYFLINRIKIDNPLNFQHSIEYANLIFLVPVNLIIFYFWPQDKLQKKHNVYLLLFVFAQIAIAEKLADFNFALDYPLLDTAETLTTFGVAAFLIAFISLFWRATIRGRILDYGMFFVVINIFMGFLFSNDPSAVTIFFFNAGLIMLLAISEDTYYGIYKDYLTGFSSRKAFMIQSPKFPLKYSVGILSIDNYKNLHKAFGKRGRNNLVKMIAMRVEGSDTDGIIYRNKEDEFVLIFKNEDKNKAYEKIEKIRRSIASASFILSNHKKPIKLTVSGSVSEKKRSDAHAVEVLARAHKALQKTSAFSYNVTSKA